MKRKIGILGLGVLLLAGCGAPKLENGQEAVVTFKDDAKISVDDLYAEIKNDFALQSLVTMIDKYILETEFKDYMETAKAYAKNYVNAMRQNYESEDAFLQVLQQYYGYATVDAYEDYMYTSYMESHAIEEYAKSLVSDKDIEKYYNDKAKGDVEISHILITAQTTSDMTDDEKTQAKDDAKKKAEDLLKQITDSENPADTFKSLVKDNSEDEASKDSEGALGKVTYGDLSSAYDEILDAAYSINDNEVYGKVVTTELGYHIILKTKSYEKESLDDLKDEIRELLSKDILENTADISIEALQHYRKTYELDIKDSELKRQYDNYIKRVLASANSTDEN